MRLIAFSIFDSKAEVFSPPFFRVSEGIARREFSDLVNDDKTAIGRHPGDFALFQIGEFLDHKGTLINEASPRNLGLGVSFKGNSLEVAK